MAIPAGTVGRAFAQADDVPTRFANHHAIDRAIQAPAVQPMDRREVVGAARPASPSAGLGAAGCEAAGRSLRCVIASPAGRPRQTPMLGSAALNKLNRGSGYSLPARVAGRLPPVIFRRSPAATPSGRTLGKTGGGRRHRQAWVRDRGQPLALSRQPRARPRARRFQGFRPCRIRSRTGGLSSFAR